MSKSIPLYHLELVRDRNVSFDESVKKTEQCAEILHEILDRSPVEQMVVIYLDPQGNLMGTEKVGLGSLTAVTVSMAEIFRGALIAGAPSIVLGHNHPYNDPTPSKEDWSLTDHARYLGEQLGILVYNHIIVTPTGKHISMKDEENKQQDKLVGRVLDAIAALPPEHQKQMEDRMKKYGLNPNDISRNPTKDIPINIPNGTSLTDLMKYKLDKLNNSKKNSN